ncbi:hypothetical protein [Roseobacter sp. HKCCA0434]|uniref:hypothetical protein n=1 Tax=Roseobacter sp. HKCCA0434 TaxID=3079297 RepID=UPI002905E16A|nr:hypothetical protein [Roseobacter sp. HKCCA0434]
MPTRLRPTGALFATAMTLTAGAAWPCTTMDDLVLAPSTGWEFFNDTEYRPVGDTLRVTYSRVLPRDTEGNIMNPEDAEIVTVNISRNDAVVGPIEMILSDENFASMVEEGPWGQPKLRTGLSTVVFDTAVQIDGNGDGAEVYFHRFVQCLVRAAADAGEPVEFYSADAQAAEDPAQEPLETQDDTQAPSAPPPADPDVEARIARMTDMSRAHFLDEYERLAEIADGANAELFRRVGPDFAQLYRQQDWSSPERDAAACMYDRFDAADRLDILARTSIVQGGLADAVEADPDLDYVSLVMDPEVSERYEEMMSGGLSDDDIAMNFEAFRECGLFDLMRERIDMGQVFRIMEEEARARGMLDD